MPKIRKSSRSNQNTKKTSRRVKKSSGPQIKGKGKLLIPAALTLIVFISLIATGYFVFLRPVEPPGPLYTPTDIPIAPTEKQEITTTEKGDSVSDIVKTDPMPESLHENQFPKIAIVIDDMGYRKEVGDKLLDMEANLTFSFLPFGPHSEKQAQKAHDLGRDVLLHLPLEPTDPTWNLGPGGMLLSMNKAELEQIFSEDLAIVPMAVGVNNHMGSRFTEDRWAMATLLEIIQNNDLFFLDSITTPKSIAYDLAKAMGIRTVRRHVFLDNEPDKDKITKQLETLISMAEKYGWAIGLAHPHPATYETLLENQEQIDNRVQLVNISELVK